VPRVWADRQALLQAFLNLAKNSHRALEGQTHKEMIVRVLVEDQSVAIRWMDTGLGVAQAATSALRERCCPDNRSAWTAANP